MTMRRIILPSVIVIAATAAASACYLFAYEPAYSGGVSIPQKPLAIAHRGFGNLAPDNSLAAVEIAMRNGMDGVDVDGQMSKDGEFVIFHDLSVDRLTTGSGRVTSLTLDELRALDLGAGFGNGWGHAPVATFEEFLNATKGKGLLMVELKVPGAGRTGFEEKAIEIVRRNDAYDDVVFSSFNPLVLYRLKKLDPRIRTALIFMDTNWNEELLAEIKPGDEVALPWFLRQEWIRRAVRKIVKPDLLSVNAAVDPSTIDRLVAKGWPIFLWTVDEEESIESAIAERPYGIISDEPLLLKNLLDSRE
jgi:glycerophosphoryl diester phosphodiesterase